MKRNLWRNIENLILWAVLSLMACKLAAQEAVDSTKLALEKRIQAKYTIVESDGKLGIFDQEKQEPVTETDMDYIQYSHCAQPEEDMCFCYFYFERGYMHGKIGINMQDNSKMEISMENPAYVAKLDACTTIDSLTQQNCQDVLYHAMEQLDGSYGQVAILDAQTANLLGWVALQKDSTGWCKAPLLKEFCTNQVLKPIMTMKMLEDSGLTLLNPVDTLPKSMTYKQALLSKSDMHLQQLFERNPKGQILWELFAKGEPMSNALEWASLFNFIYHQPTYLIPTLEGDSVRIDTEITFEDQTRQAFREVAVDINKTGGAQAKDAPKGVSLAGFYDQLLTSQGHREWSFVGCIPAEKPSYCICMVVHSADQKIGSSSPIAPFVNRLIERVMK